MKSKNRWLNLKWRFVNRCWFCGKKLTDQRCKKRHPKKMKGCGKMRQPCSVSVSLTS